MRLKKYWCSLLLIASSLSSQALIADPTALTLHYTEPASAWTEALPVGNGRLGAMVFGNVTEELIQLNEATLWSGGPVAKSPNLKAFSFLAQTRDALKQEDYAKAGDLVKNMQGFYTESYLPLGDLHITHNFDSDKVSSYYRDLDIQDGIATTRFYVDGVNYKREVFASAPAGVIVIRISADKPEKLSLNISIKSALRSSNVQHKEILLLKGRAPTHVDPSYYNAGRNPVVYDKHDHCKGMHFELAVQPIVTGGHVEVRSDSINITKSSEVILQVASATSFNGFDKCPASEGKDEHKLIVDQLRKNLNRTYSELLFEHLQDFHHFFNRVSLSLNPEEKSKSAIPTLQRLKSYFEGKVDSGLESLYFQYGRYLLISASRTANAPANLQGIWNKEVRPPWSSNYTTNINVQMNYWPVESANLSELFSPLNDLIGSLAVTGRNTAEHYYRAPGWVVHHNSDIWASSAPVGDLGNGDPMWANWYMGGNWLSRHLWEHYLYTGDKRYLKKIYPLMKGAGEFTLAWLQKDKNNYWVTMPSTSPENLYHYGDKKQGSVTVAATMDMAIVRDLLRNLIAASEVLDTDELFRKKLIATQKELFPFQVGSKGQLQEWYKDYEDVDPHHRHVSHLYALHPATEISPLLTPELAKAAKKTLELRGDNGTGWSLAWKVNMWARLLDGDHSYQLLRNLLRLTSDTNIEYSGHGGVYPNLFDAHPPFQIDGNFAGTAGVIEMLLQSQNNEIHLLPALPDVWKSGEVTGLVARGNFIVDINWVDNKLVFANINARRDGPCTIRSNTPMAIKSLQLKSKKSTIGHTLTFNARRGESYLVE